MATHDETNGWIFTDEAHTWMNTRRVGRWTWAEPGLFTIKHDFTYEDMARSTYVDPWLWLTPG